MRMPEAVLPDDPESLIGNRNSGCESHITAGSNPACILFQYTASGLDMPETAKRSKTQTDSAKGGRRAYALITSLHEADALFAMPERGYRLSIIKARSHLCAFINES